VAPASSSLLENASGRFHPGVDAPSGDEGVGECRIGQVDRQAIIEHAAITPKAS
jgi:hypothetical protein